MRLLHCSAMKQLHMDGPVSHARIACSFSTEAVEPWSSGSEDFSKSMLNARNARAIVQGISNPEGIQNLYFWTGFGCQRHWEFNATGGTGGGVALPCAHRGTLPSKAGTQCANQKMVSLFCTAPTKIIRLIPGIHCCHHLDIMAAVTFPPGSLTGIWCSQALVAPKLPQQ